MIRILRIAAAAAVVLLLAGLFTWYLAFRVGSEPPSSLAIDGLASSVRVEWFAGGDAIVRLEDPADLERAIGAVHILGKPWIMLLYRQAALGRLSEWYGRETLPSDHHVQRLGIPVTARATWNALPEEEKARLEAYAAGVNAALDRRRVRLAPAMATLDVDPEPWEPWHSLAVERLFAWMGVRFPDDSSGDRPEVAELLEAREALARLLGSGGLDHGAIWHMAGHPGGLFVRWVYGSSGVPPVSVLAVEQAGGQRELATWIGLPAAWAGVDGDRAWAVLPSGRVWTESGTRSVAARFEPIRLRDGSRDVAVRRTDGTRTALSDSLWLVWSGFAPGSDLEAVRGVASGLPARFVLFDGLGMTLGPDATARALGPAPFREGGVTLVSSAPEAPWLTRTLAGTASAGSRAVLHEVGSAWGAARKATVTADLGSDSAAVAVESVAWEYLRNWDGGFDGASIGATLFEALPVDSLSAGGIAFQAAVDSLRLRLGPDITTWRWERDEAGALRFPGYVAAGPYPELRPLPDRYMPVEVPRVGHPTSPSWGSAHSWVASPRPAAWEAFLDLRDGGSVLFRRPFVPFDQLLGRFSPLPEDRALKTLSDPEARLHTTRLTPPDA